MPDTWRNRSQAVPGPILDPPSLDICASLRKEAHAALKRGFTATDIYDHPREMRLDKRWLLEGLRLSQVPSLQPSFSVV